MDPLSKQIYPWKRFWYPRSADFLLTDRGYLADPDGEYGSALNPEALSFDNIRDLPCLVLLGEPGIGKSTALQSSQAVLQFDLGAFQTDTSLTNAVFSNSIMQAWSQGTGILSLALDSLDEGRLAISNIAKILLREFNQFDVSRLRLCISCRTADWPHTLEEGLQNLWGEQNVHVYQLAPLRRQDVALAAQTNQIEPSAFLTEVEQREAVPFAIKPVTLEFLLTSFKRRQSFPATKAALYLDGCRNLCEPSEVRRDAGWQGDLSADARVRIAARIAALTIFGGFSAVWNEADRGDVPDGDITLRRMAGGAERVQDIEIIVDEHALSEVLDTGLFASSGSNRLGWSTTPMLNFWPPSMSPNTV
jgi:predicted NACHT family NTPase